MQSLARLGVSALAFAALGLMGVAARAETGVSFTLDYVAPKRCPGRSEFLAAVRARSRLALETGGLADVRIDVELEESGERVAGTLRLRLRDGQTSERAIPHSTCGEAITSMALIAAMVIDGGSLDAPSPPSPSSRPSASATSAPPSAAASVRIPQNTEAATRQIAPDRSSPWPIQFGAVIAGTVRSAVAPGSTFGMEAGLELAWRRRGWFAPILRVTAGLAESAFEPVDDAGRARYRLIGTSWSVCPVRLAWVPSVVVRPCAVVEVGDLQGTGSSVSGEREDHMLWLGFGAGGRFELVLAEWLGSSSKRTPWRSRSTIASCSWTSRTALLTAYTECEDTVSLSWIEGSENTFLLTYDRDSNELRFASADFYVADMCALPTDLASIEAGENPGASQGCRSCAIPCSAELDRDDLPPCALDEQGRVVLPE